MKKSAQHSPEVRKRAVRMVLNHQKDYGSQWDAIIAIRVFSLDGKSTPLVGFDLKKPYTVLFCDADTVAFSSQSIGSDKDKLTVFHFVSEDTFWVYMGSTDPRIPDINSREFFQRTTDLSN